MDTARDSARNDSAWDLHQDEDRPYLVNALYAKRVWLAMQSYKHNCVIPFNSVKWS